MTFSDNAIDLDLSALQVDGGVVRGVVEGLVPGSRYVVIVQAINGAVRNNGVGVASDPVTITTDSGKWRKSDIWTSGIILHKICRFTLPVETS